MFKEDSLTLTVRKKDMILNILVVISVIFGVAFLYFIANQSQAIKPEVQPTSDWVAASLNPIAEQNYVEFAEKQPVKVAPTVNNNPPVQSDVIVNQNLKDRLKNLRINKDGSLSERYKIPF